MIIAGSIIMGVLIFVVARIVIITDVLDPGDPTRELGYIGDALWALPVVITSTPPVDGGSIQR